MLKILVAGLGCCAVLLGQTALASPQADAKDIAQVMVHDAAFAQTMRDRLAEAAAQELIQTLAQRSVKLRDRDRLNALMPDLYTPEIADRIEGDLTRALLTALTEAELAELAAHMSPGLPAPAEAGPEMSAGAAEMTLQEQLVAAELALQDMKAPLERARTKAGFTLLGVIIREGFAAPPELKAADVADILAVPGVFAFPNRIIRQNMISAFAGKAP